MYCPKVISKGVRAIRSDCTTQEPRRAGRITRLLFEIPILCFRHRWLERNSMKNLSKIHENGAKIHTKSMQNRSWAVLGARSRFGNAPGRAWDGSGTPKKDPGTDLRASGAGQKRLGTGQKLPRAGPRTLPDDSGAIPERTWCTERCRARSRNDFASFSAYRAKARSLKFVRPRSVS